MTRVVEPGATQEFCDRNDVALWQCLSRIMQIPATEPDDVRETASMPMVLGGLGLRSARRTSQAASIGPVGRTVCPWSNNAILGLQHCLWRI